MTLLMINDSYLPGALMVAHALRRQETRADLVCMVTPDITASARYALDLLFDRVVQIDSLRHPHAGPQKRQDLAYMFTRLHALRLGRDGDLGLSYDKVVLLDADVLPLRRYDRLFDLDTPAGIVNESKSHVVENRADGSYLVPPSVEVDGTWKWHRIYDPVCPHGHKIPREITDRVLHDASNMGINGSLFVLEPSMRELEAIAEDVARPEIKRLIGEVFAWPNMQYLTMRWSGRWTNIDLRFSSFNGYPRLSVLYGTHYAGVKPWRYRQRSIRCYARYPDFKLWYREYVAMVTRFYPRLLKLKRLSKLLRWIEDEHMAQPEMEPGPLL